MNEKFCCMEIWTQVFLFGGELFFRDYGWIMSWFVFFIFCIRTTKSQPDILSHFQLLIWARWEILERPLTVISHRELTSQNIRWRLSNFEFLPSLTTQLDISTKFPTSSLKTQTHWSRISGPECLPTFLSPSPIFLIETAGLCDQRSLQGILEATIWIILNLFEVSNIPRGDRIDSKSLKFKWTFEYRINKQTGPVSVSKNFLFRLTFRNECK